MLKITRTKVPPLPQFEMMGLKSAFLRDYPKVSPELTEDELKQIPTVWAAVSNPIPLLFTLLMSSRDLTTANLAALGVFKQRCSLHRFNLQDIRLRVTTWSSNSFTVPTPKRVDD
jgi:hypothetical protein